MATRPADRPERRGRLRAVNGTLPDSVAPAANIGSRRPYVADVRSRRPYVATRSQLRSGARRLASIVALVSIDAGGVIGGLYGALVLRELSFGRSPDWGYLWRSETGWLAFLLLVTGLVFAQASLYAERERRPGSGRIVSALLLVALITLAFGVGTGHRFSTFGLAPTALVMTALVIALLRAAYDTMTRDLLRRAGVRRRALLAGTGESITELHRMLGSGRSGIAYDFVGAVAPSAHGVDLPVVGNLAALPDVLASQRIDELVVNDWDFGEEQLLEIVEHAHRQGVKVRIAPKTTELLMHRAEYVPGQGVPLFELRPPAFVVSDWMLKRGFDLLVSALVVVVGLPLWLAIALLVKLSSRGPVFYRDRRIGLGEREFGMFKFRTMRADAEALLPQLETANEASGPLFKIRLDPRVTRVGALLRRFSLDEIPQVLNVLRGEMSLVGPRPLPLRDYAQLEPWHRKRYHVLPGITGLWQIAGRSDLGFDDLVRLDFYYLDNWSIWLDVSILFRTIPAVLAARGAY